MNEPTLRKVLLNRDVLWTMSSHALSNEHQEIMGLCLGSINNNIATVERALMIARKHKQKDRVEVSVEDLSQASEIAEQISNIDNKEMRIIAWYHSHPHITCPPSHVDVKTQGSFQMFDSCFFGLIVSCFDQNQGQIDVCAFQSHMVYSEDCPNGYWVKTEVPITVITRKERLLDSLMALQLVFLNEEKEVYDKYSDKKSTRQDVKSDLELSKSISIYESTLVRLIDTQIIPLQMSLQSKISSLQREKEELLKKLKKKKNIQQINANNDIDNRGHSSKVIETLVRIIPNWHQHCRILKNAMDGMAGIVLEQTNLNINNAECIIAIEPSKYNLRYPSCLPWTLNIKQNELLLSTTILSIEGADNTLKMNLLHDNEKDTCLLVITLKDLNISAKKLNSALKLDKLRQ